MNTYSLKFTPVPVVVNNIKYGIGGGKPAQVIEEVSDLFETTLLEDRDNIKEVSAADLSTFLDKVNDYCEQGVLQAKYETSPGAIVVSIGLPGATPYFVFDVLVTDAEGKRVGGPDLGIIAWDMRFSGLI